MQLEETVDSYLEEWVKGLPPPDATHDWYREALQESHATLNLKGAWNVVNREGDKHLWTAARLLLQRTGEQRRVTLQTARRCLVEAHSAHLQKAKRTGRLSEHAVVAGATERLTECARSSGCYVIPIQFAPSAKSTRFRIGPAVILAKATFEADYQAVITAQADGTDDFGVKAVAEWSTYCERYDHFIVVEVRGHEIEMAWKAAREIAEYILNHYTDEVRLLPHGRCPSWERVRVGNEPSPCLLRQERRCKLQPLPRALGKPS